MDTADLSILVHAAVGGSLSEAARRLGLTPAVASRGLQRLEAQIGARLVHRTTRSFALTADGEAYLPYAQAILDAESVAASTIGSSKGAGASGLLRVTAPATFGRKIVVPLLSTVLAQHANLRMDLQLTDDVVDLVAAGLDLAVRITPPLPSSGLVARRLSSNRLLFCAAPSYLAGRQGPRRVEDFSAHECLVLGGAASWMVECRGRRRQVRVRGRVLSNSNEALREACVAGLGIGLHSAWDVQAEIVAGQLSEILLEDGTTPVSNLSIWAVTPTTRLTPQRVGVFVAALRRALRAASVEP